MSQEAELFYNCQVCGDATDKYQSYGVLACSSCRVFFRRQSQKSTLDSCSLFRNCEITKNTRTFCQYCRYQKCLKMGMNPKRIRKPKAEATDTRSLWTKKEAIEEAIKILDVPNMSSRPFLKVTYVANFHSSMPFTKEEYILCKDLQDCQMNAWLSIPFPLIIMSIIFDSSQEMSRDKCDVAIQATIQRLIKFVTQLEPFKRQRDPDQFALLAQNAWFLSIPITANYLRYNSEQQTSVVLYGTPDQATEFNYPKVEMSEVFPWITTDHPLHKIIKDIQELDLDHISILLVSCILLFNAPHQGLQNEFEVTKTQDYFRLTLFRYLSSKMSQSGAVMKMEQIESILHSLIFIPLKNFES